jgi:anthranilate/para-aminobenzoate synthase component II
MFKGVDNPLRVARYHSLIVSKSLFPRELTITALSGDDEVMAFAHHNLPIYGVQFHPESVLT